MSRQIKFRGKGLDLNIWMYGDLLQYNEGSVAIGTHGRYTDDGYSFNDYWNETPYVDEDTVGQFTGLLDRNGKEIYEGDMLQDNEIVWEVFWCDDVAAFMVEQYKSESDSPKMFLLSDVAKGSEVIGNIHEQSKKLER